MISLRPFERAAKKMKSWPTVLLIVVSVIVLGSLIATFLMPVTGGMENQPFERWYGNWPAVIASVILFVVFLLGFSRPKGISAWRTAGIGTAFFIALFTEMFGIHLTLYLLSGLLGSSPASFGHLQSHLCAYLLDRLGLLPLEWGVYLVMVLSMMLISAGVIIAALGWRRIYQAQGQLVTDGIYGVIRHPQYVGFCLVIIGFLIQWPTALTLIMATILLVMYTRLARWEEERLRATFGEAYEVYRNKVGGFIPK